MLLICAFATMTCQNVVKKVYWSKTCRNTFRVVKSVNNLNMIRALTWFFETILNVLNLKSTVHSRCFIWGHMRGKGCRLIEAIMLQSSRGLGGCKKPALYDDISISCSSRVSSYTSHPVSLHTSVSHLGASNNVNKTSAQILRRLPCQPPHCKHTTLLNNAWWETGSGRVSDYTAFFPNEKAWPYYVSVLCPHLNTTCSPLCPSIISIPASLTGGVQIAVNQTCPITRQLPAGPSPMCWCSSSCPVTHKSTHTQGENETLKTTSENS